MKHASPRGEARAPWGSGGRAAALVALGGLLFVLGVQLHARATSGFARLHWGSEDLIQTLPLVDLEREPVQSLVFLHVQPPGLDLLRATLARFGSDPDPMVRAAQVDRGLVFLWAVAYAVLGSLLFTWLRQLVTPAAAIVGTLLFFLHPAALLFTTVPDTTMLSALLLTWSIYEMWRFGQRRESIFRLALSVVALFLVRSIFQWPALLFYAGGLLLLGVTRRRILVFLALTVPVLAAYGAKQLVLFGLTTTTSFTGYNCMRSIGVLPYGYGSGEHIEMGEDEIRAVLGDGLARRQVGALRRETKLTGVQNFNHLKYLVYGRTVLEGCRREYASRSWAEILAAYGENLRLYLAPSSHYASLQPILDHVPWRGPWDFVFSGPPLVLLVAAAAAVWVRRQWRARLSAGPGRHAPPSGAVRRLAALALAPSAPALMVVAASVLFERGENMRFKFFVEPLFIVLLVSQGGALLGRHAPRGGGPEPTPPDGASGSPSANGHSAA